MEQQFNNVRARVTGDYRTFEEFYPFYLSQHANKTNRMLHVFGTSLALLQLLHTIFYFTFGNFLMIFLIGYGFAWVGHFFFEKNKPATFKYPLWSLMGDFRMLKETIFGRTAYSKKIGGV